MVSVPSRIVPLIIRATGRNKIYFSEEGARNRVRERTLNPAPFGPPKNLRTDVRVDIRHEDGWPVYTLTPTNSAPVGSFVYLHGEGVGHPGFRSRR